jgi:hypothetical protein
MAGQTTTLQYDVEWRSIWWLGIYSFHIPTIIGAGLISSQPLQILMEIFGGTDDITRDLQWKSFIPVFMTMSGWAKKDKQHWDVENLYFHQQKIFTIKND